MPNDAFAAIETIASDENVSADIRALAEAILLLRQLVGQNRGNNSDAFEQIEELGKRSEEDDET